MKSVYCDRESGTMADIVHYESDKYVLTRIITPASYRGKGHARKLMAEILADADKEKVVMMLEINPYGPMDYKQLEAWYTRLGFVHDPTSNVFIRQPVSNGV